MTGLKQTPLHALHAEHGAHFTDFGGWEMPLRYGSELAEHRAVRETAGLFDLSHMGEIWVSGPDAASYLNSMLVGNLAAVKVGRAKYSLLCNAQGGIVDDLIVYRVSDTSFLVVPNAGNAEAVSEILRAGVAKTEATSVGSLAGELAGAVEAGVVKGFDVEVNDASAETALIAIQGPASAEIVTQLVDAQYHETIADLAYYSWAAVEVVTNAGAVDVLLARTGYTGEDGFELYLPNDQAAQVWRCALEVGAAHGLLPAGLAARDSLRLEAGMPLYGNELGPEVNPFEAGLGGVVSFKKTEQFSGREALAAVHTQGTSRVLVGLRGAGRRAGRGGYAVHGDGRQIGVITSGQPSPTLGYPIALAFVEPEYAEVGTQVEVDLRGKLEPFEVVALPFYRRDNG